MLQNISSKLMWEFLGSGFCSRTNQIHPGKPGLVLPASPCRKEAEIISAPGDWGTPSNGTLLPSQMPTALELWNFSSFTVISVATVRVLKSILCFRINICWHFQNEFFISSRIPFYGNREISEFPLCCCFCPEEAWSLLLRFPVPFSSSMLSKVEQSDFMQHRAIKQHNSIFSFIISSFLIIPNILFAF